MLRKGTLPPQKFRGVLHAQKIQLMENEYAMLEAHFKSTVDPTKIDYSAFVSMISLIFTEKDLERDPLKQTQAFRPPSILDPKNLLSEEEEQQLDWTLMKLGTEVRNKRLLLKPFF